MQESGQRLAVSGWSRRPRRHSGQPPYVHSVLTYRVIREYGAAYPPFQIDSQMRVNARFEGDYERQVEFLTQATGMGVSDVLKASVNHYYRAVRGKTKPQLTHLRAFIGKQSSGRSDVASRAKELFGEGVADKHIARKRAR